MDNPGLNIFQLNSEIEIVNTSNSNTNLARFRRIANYSQALLAAKSGVPLRTIQQYESHARDINKASIHTIWLLAKALQCRPDQLLDIEIDSLTKCIVRRNDGVIFETFGETITRKITKAEVIADKQQGWKFNWKKIQDDGFEILELYTAGDNKLQGRISYIPRNGFYFIDHIESAPSNIGHNGLYIGVAANMFAIICKLSKDAGFEGYVSFMSKNDNKVMNNYIEKLHAKRIGTSQMMYLDGNDANRLISEYGLED